MAARHRADAEGRPRIVYTRLRAGQDTFYYAYHNGDEWISRKIVEAGRGREHFSSGGATLDHEDPRFVYLSRTIGTGARSSNGSRPTKDGHGDAPADVQPFRVLRLDRSRPEA